MNSKMISKPYVSERGHHRIGVCGATEQKTGLGAIRCPQERRASAEKHDSPKRKVRKGFEGINQVMK